MQKGSGTRDSTKSTADDEIKKLNVICKWIFVILDIMLHSKLSDLERNFHSVIKVNEHVHKYTKAVEPESLQRSK